MTVRRILVTLSLVVGPGEHRRRFLNAFSRRGPRAGDTLYVEELIVPQTISTMPSDTIHAFQDRGVVALTPESHLQDAMYLFNQLYAADIDYDDIVATLEREGIEKSRLLHPTSGRGC
jgi:transaldolase